MIHPFSRAAVSEAEQRERDDRRQRPTPMFSRYTLFGRRRRNRRDRDPGRAYFVDRPAGWYWRAIVAVLLLVIADAISTLHIISRGGGEANPIMAWMLEQGTGWFLFVKLSTAVWGFVLLAVTPEFSRINLFGAQVRGSKVLGVVLLAVYGCLLFFHLYLLAKIHLLPR